MREAAVQLVCHSQVASRDRESVFSHSSEQEGWQEGRKMDGRTDGHPASEAGWPSARGAGWRAGGRANQCRRISGSEFRKKQEHKWWRMSPSSNLSSAVRQDKQKQQGSSRQHDRRNMNHHPKTSDTVGCRLERMQASKLASQPASQPVTSLVVGPSVTHSASQPASLLTTLTSDWIHLHHMNGIFFR